MNWLPALLALVGGSGDARDPREPDDPERRQQLERARQKLREAMEKEAPAPAATEKTRPNVGQKVDKYFGTRLPPVCERLGCYLTDDGTRYYCVNPGCQKHKKRATKHSRVKRPKQAKDVFFRCPKCLGRNVEVMMLVGEYACNDCQHRWPRRPDDEPGGDASDTAEPGLGEPADRAGDDRP